MNVAGACMAMLACVTYMFIEPTGKDDDEKPHTKVVVVFSR